jgi:hypothetical protein
MSAILGFLSECVQKTLVKTMTGTLPREPLRDRELFFQLLFIMNICSKPSSKSSLTEVSSREVSLFHAPQKTCEEAELEQTLAENWTLALHLQGSIVIWDGALWF